jgi:hypothetical protein
MSKQKQVLYAGLSVTEYRKLHLESLTDREKLKVIVMEQIRTDFNRNESQGIEEWTLKRNVEYYIVHCFPEHTHFNKGIGDRLYSLAVHSRLDDAIINELANEGIINRFMWKQFRKIKTTKKGERELEKLGEIRDGERDFKTGKKFKKGMEIWRR